MWGRVLVCALAGGGGLLIAFLPEFLAFLLAGAPDGGGWGAPADYAWLLFIAYPVTLARIADPGGRSIVLDVASLLAFAVVAVSFSGEPGFHDPGIYRQPTEDLVYAWLVFCLLWPLGAAASIWVRLRRSRHFTPAKS